jgi:thymidylate synthase
MSNADTQYTNLLKNIRDNGIEKGDRTGTGTKSIFGTQMRFNISENRIPLITTKKIFTRSFIHETLWFLSGNTSIKYLKDNKVGIWDSWTFNKQYDLNGNLVDGDIGEGYGKQWRKWEDIRLIPAIEWKKKEKEFKQLGYEVKDRTFTGDVVAYREIDQIANVIQQLKESPDSRRIILSPWNAGRLEFMSLVPCHSFVQWNTEPMSYEECFTQVGIDEIILEQQGKLEGIIREDNKVYYSYPEDPSKSPEDIAAEVIQHYNIPTRRLSCHLYQRSCDFCIGAPFNIAQYALLTHMLAQVTNMVPKELVWTGGDTHIYQNHFELLEEQLNRESIDCDPKVLLNSDIKNIDDFEIKDIVIVDYESHGRIDYPVAV